ncbi:aspartic peptidase domain-containing protein [Aspergillus pseudotamarii]|uniref:Aspartic peptidase domain-containing protein n=1 Tax=Aspergillus pseudotamarii TaxID=132259 RepID=A0A5N6T800_ASPPS|nr:aspartic peptidase domain-containing protein [Aspergillus pseudotamarii]KAE8142311.1 aspartic peptidase domain-containing protein [Aspergillus pseudotamarii]
MKSFPGIALLVGLPICLAKTEPESEPASVDADVDWYGNDGTWSAVNIWVGSQLKTVSLFPSTVHKKTWIVGGSGCENSSLADCSKRRGGLFNTNESTTWKPQSSGPGSRDPATATYDGNETIYVDFRPATEQTIEIINDTDTWIGLLGLGIHQSGHIDNFGVNVMETAFINDSFAPSGSYGYTAGAHYRLKGTPASLTIGGVDRARFYDNKAIFHLDRNGIPVVSLNTISISSGMVDDDATHMDDHIIPSHPGGSTYFTLDSSTSYLWLPSDTFDAFGAALNLTYDDSSGFYAYGNDTSLRERLLAMNISITLSISDLPDSSQSVNITLPFQAFDHSLTYPYPDLPSKYSDTPLPYLPIRRANTNDEQRIGRVFFQEAYLAVDYEREQFSLYQAKFGTNLVSSDSDTDIVPIDSYLDKVFEGLLSDRPGLSTATKAGVGVGTGAGAILIIAGACLFIRKHRAVSSEKGVQLSDSVSNSDSEYHSRPGEVDGTQERHPELPSDASCAIYELPGSGIAELEAGPSSIRGRGCAPPTDEKRHCSRHSETRSSIAASLASRVTTESSDDEDHVPSQKGHGESSGPSPPKYTP